MLPPETVDHILSFVHSDQDYTTLERCSVVFPHIVDRHLYSQIGFTPQSHNPIALFPSRISFNKGAYVVHPTNFSKLLVNRPHLANYVHVVVIRLPGKPDSAFLSNLSSILPILLHIKSISLSVFHVLYWHTLGPEFCMAFRNCIRLPSTKEVAIAGINGFSLDNFHDSENLKKLILYGEFHGGESTHTSSYPHLVSLSVDPHTDTTRMVSWTKSINTNTLNTLCLRISQGDVDLPKSLPIIRACSTALVNLELNMLCISTLASSDPLYPHFFPELRLPSLGHSVIRSFLYMKNSRVNLPSLPSLVPFLRSIRTNSSIRLTLHLHFRFEIPPLIDLDWSEIAAILILPMFRHPIELNISRITSQRPSNDWLADLISSFEQHSDIKKLLGEGKLAVIRRLESGFL